MGNLFDPYGLRDRAAGLGRQIGGGIRGLGSGLPRGSRLASAFDSAGSFAESLPSLAYELSPMGVTSGLAEQATDFLLNPVQSPAKPSAAPGAAPKAPSGLASPAQPMGTPDMDSAPGDGLTEFAPGVRFSGGRSGPEDLTGLRRTAAGVRPLMALRGDGGGPLSAADMKINRAAMNQIDDMFTNEPREQRLRELTGRAQESQAEMLANDPFAVQKREAEIALGKGVGLQAHKFGLQQQAVSGLQQQIKELDSESMEANEELRQLQSHPAYLELRRKADSGDPDAARRIEQAEAVHKNRASQAELRKRSILQSYGMATGEAPSSLFQDQLPSYR